MSTAFWISPKSEIVRVNTSHINAVICYPNKFGYKLINIKKLYKKHHEKLGVEGNAREEIIRDLVCKGWIRIRRYSKYWSITTGPFTKKQKTVIADWASKILKQGIHGTKEIDKYMAVRIVCLKQKKTFENHTIKDIAKGVLISRQSIVNKNILILSDLAELEDII